MTQDKLIEKTHRYVYCPKCATALTLRKMEDELVHVCPKCASHYWMNPKPVVSMLVRDPGGNILMVRRAHQPLKNYWVLPGGFIRIDETPEQAVKRETKEEIGRIPKNVRIIGAYRIDNDPRGIHIDIIYKGEIAGPVSLSPEHTEFRYFRPDRLPRNIAYKHRDAIRDCMNLLEAVAKRRGKRS